MTGREGEPSQAKPETIPVLYRNGKLSVFNRRQFLSMGSSAAVIALAGRTGIGSSSWTARNSAKPSGQLNVATATFGSEGWMPRFGNTLDRNVWTAFGDQIYGLNRQDGRSFDPREGIVSKSTIDATADKVTWTVKLKKGIPFHDNNGILTASDVKFTYLDYLKPGIAASKAIKAGLINNDPNNIDVVDDETLVFNMDRAWVTPHFEYQLSIGLTGDVTGVVPESYWNRVGDDGYRMHPISTGPFKWVQYTPGQSIMMEAVVPHWRKTPEYERLFFQKVPDSATRLAMLQAGQVDITDLTPLEVQQIQNNRRIWVMQYSAEDVTHIQLSGIVLPGVTKYHADIYDSKLPWVGSDPAGSGPTAVRAAMDYAIDRNAISKSVLRGYAKPAALPFAWTAPGAPWADPRWKPWPYDPSKAKELLRQAGFPNGFEMSMYVYADQASWQPDVVTAVAGFWNKVGIQVNLIQAEYDAAVRPHIFDRNLQGIAWEFTDAGYQFPETTAGIALTSNSTINYFEVAGFDTIAAQSQGVLDEKRLASIAKQEGSYVYDHHLMHSIVDTHVLWGLNGAKVKAWDRTLHRPELSGEEWIIKPSAS